MTNSKILWRMGACCIVATVGLVIADILLLVS